MSNLVSVINKSMKYQCIGISLPEATVSTTPVVGRTNMLTIVPDHGWPLYTSLVQILVENGDLDAVWHELNSVVTLDDGYVQTTLTFNTLAGAQGYYNLVVDENLDVRVPSKVRNNKIVEVQDDGTFVQTITQSNTPT